MTPRSVASGASNPPAEGRGLRKARSRDFTAFAVSATETLTA